jgi:rfaE bifunctional protein kinase chain/domain
MQSQAISTRVQMNFDEVTERFANQKVLVIGDMMLDHYIWGDTYRISPEAPVPVVQVTNDTYTAGGAANVALNLVNLGTQSCILGYSANDVAGKQLQDILAARGAEMLPLKENNSNAPTIIKTRVLVRNQQICRIDRESSKESYGIDHSEGFYASLDKILDTVNAVIISDYAKGVVTQSLVDHILSYSQNAPALLVSIDPKPSSKLNFRGAGLLTPNRSEALQLAGVAGISYGSEYPLEEICRMIHEVYAPKLLVITLGGDGMTICKDGVILEILPTVAREVFDVSGAGDTVIATLTIALSAGLNPHEAATLANAAAGCVVGHRGTAPIQLSELKSWVEGGR